MDRVSIAGIAAFGRHGVLQQEKELGQKFIVDVTYYLDLTHAGKTDNLADAVSYADVFNIVKEEIVNQNYDLIERLCYVMIGRILNLDMRITSAEVTVKKPNAPLYGHFDWAAITMKRGRDEINLSEFRQ